MPNPSQVAATDAAPDPWFEALLDHWESGGAAADQPTPPSGVSMKASPEQIERWLRLQAAPIGSPLPERPSLEEADAYMLRCDSYSRLPELLDLAPRMERGDWLRVLGNHWSGCDNIGPHRLRLRRLLPREGPVPELMTPEEAAAYADLPDRLTVYRGCGLVNIRGASWSLDRDTAARFPFLNRYRQDRPLLVTATVRKARILALKIDRDESEIITFHARRVEVEELSEAPPMEGPQFLTYETYMEAHPMT